MRRFHGGSDALHTINAAASVIASSDNRALPAAPPQSQKRRWTIRWSLYFCFGFHRHRKRITHAVVHPEISGPQTDSSAVENPTQAPQPITLPFMAPPSSPASFLQSEPPSALQSPGKISMAASVYSPNGPASIFAIGPYAHETQLVSPPVFSTEPSTAPFTPPGESIRLTTPSSPEVPFALLLDPRLGHSGTDLQFAVPNYEFRSYQLYPGSPAGQLFSPRSWVSGSGTSSPFPDVEFSPTGPCFPEFLKSDPEMILKLDHKLSESGQGLENLTPGNFSQVPSQRISSELGAEEASSCSELKPASTPISRIEMKYGEIEQHFDSCVGETSNGAPEKVSTNEDKVSRHQKHRTLTLAWLKDFNFDSINGDIEKPHNNESEWLADGTDTGKEDLASKNWSFPVMQPNAG